MSRAKVLTGALLLSGAPFFSFAELKPARCAAPEYRQFDFWIGDWDVSDVGDARPSMWIEVRKILGGCALKESYRDANGMVGESVNVYDASRKVWHQTWATNRGQLLVFEGGMENGRMALHAKETTKDGPVAWRAFWLPQGEEVRETAEVSLDGGKTWKPRFDIVFRKRRP